ncbi:AmmeMemoRadiSam system protein B [Patescibacteria group bacterium]|nr:AmmeMemoRadiSam system protein B [Patescibacteria group bacterium]
MRQQCKLKSIPTKLTEKLNLDHGSLVPLYYLIKNYTPKNGKRLKVVPIGYSYYDPRINFDFGKIIFDVCGSQEKNIAVVSSGDLSHRLTFDAPASYSPEGAEFDKQLIQSLEDNNIESVLKIDADLIKEAGECGYLSIVMLLGVINTYNETKILKKAKFKALSYEGPFGVGYLVGYFKI